MGALENATALRKDETFRDWIETGIAYQSRLVISEPSSTPDHAVRLELAVQAAVSPKMILDLMVTAVATNPAVASKGITVGPDGVTEQDILDNIAAVWTVVAQLTFPS